MTADQDMPNTAAPEALARWMARPTDEGPFWQRQQALMQGRIEDPAAKKRPYYGYLIYPALIAGVVGCGVMFLR
jgi:hypothetical protein